MSTARKATFKSAVPESDLRRKAGGSIADFNSDLIFNTPMVRLKKLAPDGSAELYGKAEGANPGGSVKDRICLSMIEAAERDGQLKPGGAIVEPTSGNTGIGLALVAAIKGYKLVLTMPESMTVERRTLLKLYGAQIELTPASGGMQGAMDKAVQLVEKHGYFMPDQFSNPANPEVHRRTTAEEIWAAMEGRIDAFVAGIGTGGTITGVGEVLKSRLKNVLIVAVEPASSPLLSKGHAGPHRIQGIGANFVPKVLNRAILDRIITVTNEDAYNTTRRLAKEDGLLVGVSSGAAAWAALQVAKELGKGKRVVCILPDTGERYLSMHQDLA